MIVIVIVKIVIVSLSKVFLEGWPLGNEISKSDRSQKSTASRIPRDGFPSDLTPHMLTWFCHIISPMTDSLTAFSCKRASHPLA
jgi:hypothetical protein